MSKKEQQNVTNVIWFGYGSSMDLKFEGQTDITIWYEDGNSEDKPNLKESFQAIGLEYIDTLERMNKEYPGYIIPEIFYKVIVTKVKGFNAWHHEYEIDPIKILKKYYNGAENG